MNSLVSHKIRFPLDNHPSGYSGESLWADKISTNTYQLTNIPIFVYGINFGDEVLVEEDDDGILQVVKKVKSSNHHTIRVFFVDEKSGDSNFSRLKEFKGEGIGSEGWNDDLYALNVTPSRDYEEFINILNHQQDLGVIEYELAGEWSGGFDGSE